MEKCLSVCVFFFHPIIFVGVYYEGFCRVFKLPLQQVFIISQPVSADFHPKLEEGFYSTTKAINMLLAHVF